MSTIEDLVQQGLVRVNGIELHYVTRGTGPLVLLLHGFPEFWYSWRHQIPALAEHYTVVALDQRGYNESAKPEWGYETDVLVADVVEVIKALGYERAILVGHDWGGVVAWATAISYPQRIERLIVLNAPHPAIFAEQLRTNPEQRRKSLYMGFFALPFLPELLLSRNDYAALERILRGQARRADAFHDEDIEHYKDAISKPGALTAALNWYRAAARGTRGMYRASGMQVQAPTLLIWGANDRFLGSELVVGTERFVADLTVRMIDDSSHWVQQDAPDEVTRHMLAFLNTTPTSE